ncbi:MAG: 23S rRNA (uracil(1939)-C(5))-methyltransferase RlmD [Pseudomonadota bacterium]|nr:23S rRNA (uracil(1939)-C(5))-methyltransferase RlmD [Pseudomonadota bacterium]
MKASEIFEADVLDLAHDGRGVARIDGKTVFVDGALPGERVRLRIFKRRRQYDEAGLVEVIHASADRVEPKCAHFGICGGCALQHLAPAAQLGAKERQLLDNLTRIGGVQPDRLIPALRGPPWGYRRRARLGIKYVQKKGRVLVGFRERAAPYVADVRRCEVLIDRFATLPEQLASLVETLSLREKIPQVEVAAADDAGLHDPWQAALVFRLMGDPTAEDLTKLEAFADRHSVQIFLQSGGLDTVRPLRENYPPLQYTVVEQMITIQFGPVDFFQINREINASMLQAAVDALRPAAGDTVLDLFCGLGNFTLSMARHAGRVVGVDADLGLIAKARANAMRNHALNTEFHAGNLFHPDLAAQWAQRPYDLILLDPPRAGAAEILPRVAHWRPRRLVYISCHPGSLARDARTLIDGLGFRLTAAGVMDMFPHTTHVESIAVFERAA